MTLVFMIIVIFILGAVAASSVEEQKRKENEALLRAKRAKEKAEKIAAIQKTDQLEENILKDLFSTIVTYDPMNLRFPKSEQRDIFSPWEPQLEEGHENL